MQAKIPMAVKPGFHVNSNKPSEEYLIPLKLTWKSTGALEAGRLIYPKPAQEKYEFSEKPLSVFSGKFAVIANFKVAANAPAGPGSGGRAAALPGVQRQDVLSAQNVEIALPYQVQ